MRKMTNYLYDDEVGQSRIVFCVTDWEEAEGLAEEWGWTLIGEYVVSWEYSETQN